MRNLVFYAGSTSRVMRAGAVAMVLYVFAKSVSTLFNCFNCNAYVAE